MSSSLQKLEQQLLCWPRVTVYPHRFAGREFRFGKAEIGHVHLWGALDIPFTRPIHDALLDANLAEQHHWLPDSGWTTFHIHGEAGAAHALWLLRLSWLRYALRTAPNPKQLLQAETEQLHLAPKLASLFAQFLPSKAAHSLSTPTGPRKSQSLSP